MPRSILSSGVQAISTGYGGHSCAVVSAKTIGGSVLCWGANEAAQVDPVTRAKEIRPGTNTLTGL